jgi:lipopolysaccharide/colanic/teichoic acid biosynthesis glycosyltransferase
MTFDHAASRGQFGQHFAGDRGAPVGLYGRVKAVADLAIAVAMLAVSLPLLLVLMALVKLTSRGPAIYSQYRLGQRGRPYRIYKIRTMHHDCERTTGPQWSVGNDPRVTPLGRFLRRSHLDELPQLWNVIMGDMSLVGPRPERPEFVGKLVMVLPGYNNRMLVRPGITGLAQVQLPPDTDLESVRLKLECDLCYLRQMGPGLDLKILLATVLKLLGSPYATTRSLLSLPPNARRAVDSVTTAVLVRAAEEQQSGQFQVV